MLHVDAYPNFNELIAKVESPQFNRIPPINILKQEDVSYSSKFKLDNTAIKLANMAGGIQGRVPVAVSADGNCLFNAVSVLLWAAPFLERHRGPMEVVVRSEAAQKESLIIRLWQH